MRLSRLVLTLSVAMCIATPVGAAQLHKLNWTPVYAWDPSKQIDEKIFRYENGYIRNNEAQYYAITSDTLKYTNEGMQIRAIKARILNQNYEKGSDDWRKSTLWSKYASASLITIPAWQNLKVEVKATINDGAGAWPAIWLRAQNQDRYGEVDLVEQVAHRSNELWSSFHLGAKAEGRSVVTTQTLYPDFNGKAVTYEAQLTPDNAMIFINGRLVLSLPRNIETQGTKPLDQPFRLVMNMALGGAWGGKIDDNQLPAIMNIHSIKIWTLASPTSIPAKSN